MAANSTLDDIRFVLEPRDFGVGGGEKTAKQFGIHFLGRIPFDPNLVKAGDEGYSYQEIGEILDLTESQVKVYIYRGRVFLKSYIVKIETVI